MVTWFVHMPSVFNQRAGAPILLLAHNHTHTSWSTPNQLHQATKPLRKLHVSTCQHTTSSAPSMQIMRESVVCEPAGFYSSRPTLKGMVRKAAAVLQVGKLCAYAFRR